MIIVNDKILTIDAYESLLRDEFAGMALKGMLTDCEVLEEDIELQADMIAKLSYKIADAMITNRRTL